MRGQPEGHNANRDHVTLFNLLRREILKTFSARSKPDQHLVERQEECVV